MAETTKRMTLRAPSFELADCENHLLREIADKSMKRKDVAQSYALAMESSECDKIDWMTVNKAIVARWSESALQWIKLQAWSGKCFATPGGE